MKKVLSFLLMLTLTFSLAGCSSNSGSTPSTEATGGLSVIGDTFEADGVSITLLSVQEVADTMALPPAEGNIYILVEFEIVNNSDEDISISSVVSFEAYVDDYATPMSSRAIVVADVTDTLDGNVAMGKRMKGMIGFEISEAWSMLEIRFTPNPVNGDTVIFLIENAE